MNNGGKRRVTLHQSRHACGSLREERSQCEPREKGSRALGQRGLDEWKKGWLVSAAFTKHRSGGRRRLHTENWVAFEFKVFTFNWSRARGVTRQDGACQRTARGLRMGSVNKKEKKAVPDSVRRSLVSFFQRPQQVDGGFGFPNEMSSKLLP